MTKIIDLIDSYIDRDPAAKGRIETLITSPGLHSIGIYKLSNFFVVNKAYNLSEVIVLHW